jgi:flavodoxin
VARLLIVWHSATGGSEAMARAAAEGAEGETEAVLRHAAEATSVDLLTADGYLFACPENLASMSGVMKDFFDRTYYPVLGKIEGRPYASMICAGSEGEGAARQIARFATGWRLKAIADPLIICTHAQTAEAILAPKVIGENELARWPEKCHFQSDCKGLSADSPTPALVRPALKPQASAGSVTKLEALQGPKCG